MVETTVDFDYNRMCVLAGKCDQLFESQLKYVGVIQRLKADIDYTKQNFHGKLKIVAIEQLAGLVTLVMHGRTQELDKARSDVNKILQEGVTNKTFGQSHEVVQRVMETIRDNLKQVS